jgi:DNA-binding CsgD family transcriptional regulator
MQQKGIPWADPYPVYRVAQKVGYDDILGFCCVIPRMRGVAFSSPLDSNRTVSQRELRRWTRIAKHLASAYAAREALGSRPVEKADAVLGKDGTVGYLQDAHEMPAYLRDGLSRAIRRTAEVLSSRSKLSAECVRGTWDSFMEGGWSIVHHTDSDGKRLMLGVRSSPACGFVNRLTPREREIADCASLGMSAKEIAYDLGISASAARTHLSNALRKLGLSRTRELVMLRSRLP